MKGAPKTIKAHWDGVVQWHDSKIIRNMTVLVSETDVYGVKDFLILAEDSKN
jgi:hypothetical protein